MMTLFTSFGRRRPDGAGTPVRETPDGLEARWPDLPPGFEAVGEALASGDDPGAACLLVGRALAASGAALGEALESLRAAYATVRGTPPDLAAVETLAVAWSEATLEFLHEVSCEDPLTGLTSLAHLRTRLAEVYREAEQLGVPVRAGHALVVVETDPSADTGPDGPFSRALRLASVADAVRTVLTGGETVGRAGVGRAVAIVRRSAGLGAEVATLRAFLDDLGLAAPATRVWIEGLPPSQETGARLLDELAR